MDRSAAVARIQRGLGFRSDLDTEIVSALQEAQRFLEIGRTLPKFLLQEDQTLTLTSGTNAVSLPTRFIREYVQEPLRYEDTSVTPATVTVLEKMTLEEARLKYIAADAGKPVAYVRRQSTLDIYPTPDDDYALTWSYFQGGVVLSSDVENAWLATPTGSPETLIGRAGMIMAEDLVYAEGYAKFSKMYQEAWAGLRARDILAEEEADPVIVGGRL